MGLQVYYLVVSAYGWYYWSRRSSPGQEGGRPVIRLNGSMTMILTAVTAGLLIGIVFILKNFTDSDVPWGDAFTTAASIVATWMLARKILEHWLVWIVVDLVAAGLYLYKELYPTALLYIVYSVIAVAGYIQWKKKMEERAHV